MSLRNCHVNTLPTPRAIIHEATIPSRSHSISAALLPSHNDVVTHNECPRAPLRIGTVQHVTYGDGVFMRLKWTRLRRKENMSFESFFIIRHYVSFNQSFAAWDIISRQ